MIGYVLETEGGERYVGITKNLTRRLREHRHSGPMSRFVFFVAEKQEFPDREIAAAWEIETIESIGVRNLLNTSLGGYGGRKRVASDSEKAQASDRATLQHADPERRRKHGLAVKAGLANPESRAKLSRAIKESCAKPEVFAARSEAQKNSWSNPEVRARRLEGLKRGNSDPTKAEKRSAAAKARWVKRRQGE